MRRKTTVLRIESLPCSGRSQSDIPKQIPVVLETVLYRLRSTEYIVRECLGPMAGVLDRRLCGCYGELTKLHVPVPSQFLSLTPSTFSPCVIEIGSRSLSARFPHSRARSTILCAAREDTGRERSCSCDGVSSDRYHVLVIRDQAGRA